VHFGIRLSEQAAIKITGRAPCAGVCSRITSARLRRVERSVASVKMVERILAPDPELACRPRSRMKL
jgi:hypothetical protein